MAQDPGKDSKSFFERYSSKLSYSVSSLANCESEPITRIGAIQDAGFYIAVHAEDLEIIAASENVEELFGHPVNEVIGQSITKFLKSTAEGEFTIELLRKMAHSQSAEVSTKGRGTTNAEGETKLAAHVSAASGHFSFDLEPESEFIPNHAAGSIKDLVSNLNDFSDLESVSQAAAAHMKNITGFDRVMVYRFQDNHDGEVIGEALEAGLEPLLHLRYPASDIPQQARTLYFNCRYRMIVDVEKEPIPVQTVAGIARRELDLSCSSLRAVSPIHIQYLKNMGVRASLSVPIRLNNKLWGLFSCHHYSGPLHPSPEVRATAELSSQIFSSRLLDFITKRRLVAKNSTLLLNQTLLTSIAKGAGPVEAFRENESKVLALTNASGAYVRIGGVGACLGECPPEHFIDEILTELKSRDAATSWKTNSLKRDLPALTNTYNVAGALAIPLSLGFEDTIIWFRRETYLEIKWGGKPPERDRFGELKVTLEPRASFKAWAETVPDHSEAWTEEDEDAAQFLLFSFIQGIFAKAAQLSRAYQELEKVAKAKDEFIGLVSHELRTPLGIIIGWVDIMKDFPEYNPDLTEAIKVVERNAKLQINLINDLLDVSRIISGKLRIDPQANLNITNLVTEVVDGLLPTARMKSISLRWNKPENIFITGDADRLRQVIYNLMNNAIKFTPKNGTVAIGLVKRRSNYQITVEDNGVGIDASEIAGVFDRFVQVGSKKAQHQGLGLGLSIVKAIAELHGGRVYVESPGLGLGTKFTLSLPVYALAPHAEEEHFTPELPIAPDRDLEGMKFLIAEDQEDSARALRVAIERYGGKAHIVSNGRDAYEYLQKNSVNLILSDVGMPEMNGYEFLAAWRKLESERRSQPIPAIALTAYARPKDRALALEAGFQNHIAKPVDRMELLAVIRSLKKMTLN